MAFTLADIRAALKAQLVANLDRETNVYANPVLSPQPPSVTIWAADDYVDYWLSMGGNGLAAVRFTLELDPGAGDYESQSIRLDDYLSAGTGNNSSVIDAIHADRTLGDVVDDCVILTCEVTRDPLMARLPVEIRVRKVGAQT